MGENKGVGKGIYFDTFGRGMVNCDRAMQCKMSNENLAREARIRLEMRRFLVNRAYQRLVCTRRTCGVGLELGGVEKHLIETHEVEKTLARGIQMGIRAAQEGKGGGECSKRRPRNGLGPQKGLAVFDGFQCRFCEEPPARTVEEVEHHLYVFHKETEGHIWDEVPVQSWGGKGGVEEECWIVDVSKQSEEKNGEGESREVYLDELEDWVDVREETEEEWVFTK